MKFLIKKIEKNYLLLFTFWFIWKITTTTVGILGTVFFHRQMLSHSLLENLYIIFCWWDSAFFHDIATMGYGSPGAIVAKTAFPPVYPILIKFFRLLFSGNTFLAQYFVANLCFLIWILLMYYFIKTYINNKNRNIAFNTTILAMVFPYNLFFMTGYSESVFMVFLILFFIALYKKHHFWAAIFIGLASATRFVGIGLLAILLIDIVVYNKQLLFKKILALISLSFISLIPLSIYSLFLELKYGRWNEFLFAEASWGRKFQLNFLTKYYDIIINNINGDHHSTSFMVDIFNFSLLFLVLIVGAYMIVKYKQYKYFGLLIWLMLLPALFNGITLSMARLTIICFPVYYFFAEKMEKYNIPMFFLAIPAVAIQVVLILVFTAGDPSRFLG